MADNPDKKVSATKPGKIEVTPDPVPAPALRPERKIAIVGFTASKDQAPWGDPTFEKWICNNLWKFCPPTWDRVYDLHQGDEIVKDTEHDSFLRGVEQKGHDGKAVTLGGREAFVFKPEAHWPTARKFPQDEITANLGRYFTNSISWMVAHALMEGVTELHIYGVDMATGGEYASQRPSCEYMLGVAAGMGVKVFVPKESDLLKLSALYGAEDDSALYSKCAERETELVGRARQIDQQIDTLRQQGAQIQGALETTRYFKDVWTNPRATSRHESTEAQPANGHVESSAVTEKVLEEAAV